MAQADVGALNPDSEQYLRWYSLLQQTFGREPGQTHSLTQVALRALSEGAGPDRALEAARTAALAGVGLPSAPTDTHEAATATASPGSPAARPAAPWSPDAAALGPAAAGRPASAAPAAAAPALSDAGRDSAVPSPAAASVANVDADIDPIADAASATEPDSTADAAPEVAATPPQPWWTHPLLVGLLLLVLPPAGLYLLWTSDRFARVSRPRVTAIVLGCWAVILVLLVVAAITTSTTSKV